MRKPSQSPQARWSRRKKKLGRCTRCGEKRVHFKQLCDLHQGQFNAYMKAYRRARAAAKKEKNAPTLSTAS